MNTSEEIVDPTIEDMLRMMAADLTDVEIASGLHGSQGFAEDVKSYCIRAFNLEDKADLKRFSKEWVIVNPLPQQGIVEAAVPHQDLIGFYANSFPPAQDNFYFKARHKLFFNSNQNGEARQLELLYSYAMEVVLQNANCNFTGASTLDGMDIPGWSALKSGYPRHLLIGILKSENAPYWVQLSYESTKHEMASGMFNWLNTQFEVYSNGVVTTLGRDKIDWGEGKGKRATRPILN
jgi:hypothetical protein